MQVLQHPIVRLKPTIKGIFVNSHVEAVDRALGPQGVRELERRFGAPVNFRAGQDVPVRDEVRLIEHALDLLNDGRIPPDERAFEAGRLHFRNFSTTPYARLLFGLFPKNLRFMMLHSKTVAERVFKGVLFEAEEAGPAQIRITMENNDYPIDHFRGLFQEWVTHFGYEGTVTATDLGDHRYLFTLEWQS